MSGPPRVVFGMPAYNRPDTLAAVLECLLSQTRRDFVILIVDDAPSTEVSSIVETYAAIDSRIRYEANPVRLGMIGNWRKAFDRARTLYPASEYFAWVSDHDIWHPRWLEVLSRELDEHPEVVLAYPQMQRVFARDRRVITRRFDTTAMTNPSSRRRAAAREMTAGNCVYGLFRSSSLAQAGVFRPVLMPDRQVLVELSLLGRFRHVPEVLWYREVAGVFSFRRQRRMFFAGHTPLYTYLPANLQHFGVLVWDLVLRGAGRPAIGRAAGSWYALQQLWYSTLRELLRNDASWRLMLRAWRGLPPPIERPSPEVVRRG
jgi:glycosyltransferase involved in cell wall biosynthesis